VFQICCTTKLLAELGIKPRDLPFSSSPEPLKEWYVNFFRYERRKCLALLNPGTGYALVAMNVRKKEILALPQLLHGLIEKSLLADRVSAKYVADLLSDDEYAFFRTKDRSARARLNVIVRETPFMANSFRGPLELNEMIAAVFNHGPGLGQFTVDNVGLVVGEKLPRPDHWKWT
jgi:hypothetical protein